MFGARLANHRRDNRAELYSMVEAKFGPVR